MKKTIFLATVVTALSVILATERGFAQDRSQVKVKGSKVVNGVVVVDILRDKKAAELQCNEGSIACTALKAGSYLMVVLPENHGMYDCKNVEIYPPDKDDPEPDDRLGAYCLIEK